MFVYLFLACNSGELKAFPSSIEWGEVDFRPAMPDGGYSPQTIDLNNTGTGTVELILQDFDADHLCMQGFGSTPENLGELEEGQTYTLVTGVCNYIEEQGERDTEITGQIEIQHSGQNSPLFIEWSFTPIFILE